MLGSIKRAGPHICLTADPTAVAQRVQTASGQTPLTKAAQPLAKMREVLETRSLPSVPADVQVDATRLQPVEAADEVLEWLHRVRVHLGVRSYDIHLDNGCHEALGTLLSELPQKVSAVAIVSNREINQRYGGALRESLTHAGVPHHTLLVPAGERYKSLDTANRLYGDLTRAKAVI